MCSVKTILKNLSILIGKRLCWSLVLIKLPKDLGLQLYSKKILQHRCFPVSIAKFLRTSSIFKNICKRLFLELMFKLSIIFLLFYFLLSIIFWVFQAQMFEFSKKFFALLNSFELKLCHLKCHYTPLQNWFFIAKGYRRTHCIFLKIFTFLNTILKILLQLSIILIL